MKKLFFSAVALVAFSSVSMANTIAVEITIEENISKENVKVYSHRWPESFIKLLTECGQVYNEVLTAYTPVVGTTQAQAIAQGAWTGCMGGI